MHCKAQITMFLIIGIGVVIGLAYLMYSASTSAQNKVSVETEKLNSLRLQINPLTNYMANCINQVVKDNLDTTGLDPQKIADAVQNSIQSTCDLQSSFAQRVTEIQTQKPEVKVEIKPDNIILIRVQYPITLKNQQDTVTVKDFVTTLPLQTQQPVSLDTSSGQAKTAGTTTVLSSDGKVKVDIAPGTIFIDAAGNIIQPTKIGVTIQDSPQSTDPSIPGDKPSQINYKIDIYQGDTILDDVSASNLNTANPVQVMQYTPSITGTAFNSYYYDQQDPSNPHWEASTQPSQDEQRRQPTPSQEDKIQKLVQEALDKTPSAQKDTLQQKLDQLLQTPQKQEQEQIFSALNVMSLPNPAQNKLEEIKNIYNNKIPVTTETVTAIAITAFTNLRHIKKATSLPHITPTTPDPTQDFVARTAAFEDNEGSLAVNTGCGGANQPCCIGNNCNIGLVCLQGNCQAPLCVPNCGNRRCGQDGCGGSCGNCLAGQTCTFDGQCFTPCIPSCIGKYCGDDGCGGTCGICQIGQCENGVCKTTPAGCTPNCKIRGYAAPCGYLDSCGGLCSGTCGGSQQSCFHGLCIPSALINKCTPHCENKACGDDNGCGGPCSTPATCSTGICIQGVCVNIAVNT